MSTMTTLEPFTLDVPAARRTYDSQQWLHGPGGASDELMAGGQGTGVDQVVEHLIGERLDRGSCKQALNRLNEAFGSAGRDCVARSEELRRVMGAA